MNQHIRSFIALELPPEVKSLLSQLQAQLKAEGGNFVSWVKVEGIHLTLKFLGSVAEGQLPPIKDALSGIAQGSAPLHLEISHTGVFPNPQRPRVAWIGLGGETEKLLKLQEQIEQALIPLGFPAEARPFSPHLTLARLKEAAPQAKRRFGQAVLTPPLDPTPFQARTLVLMRSQLTPGGAIHTPLAQFTLGL